MTIPFDRWLLGQVAAILLWLWILCWGGARRIEGWTSWFLVGWFAASWNAEQLRLYALVLLIGQCVWLVGGLLFPMLRFER